MKSPAKKSARTARARKGLPDPETLDRPWQSAYPPGVPDRYDYPLVALPRLLDDAASDFPHSQAIEFLGGSLTYRELVDQVDRFATALRGLGVGKGDRVGLILPNCPQHIVAIFATLRLGAIVAEHDPGYTAAELEDEINDAGAKVLVCLDPVYQRLAQLKGRLPSVRHIVATGMQDGLPFPRDLLVGLRGRRDGSFHRIDEAEGVLRFNDLVTRTAPAIGPVEIDPAEDVAMLLYTAGGPVTGHGGGGRGTAPAKGAMLTHLNLVANTFQARLWVPDVQAGRESLLCVLPLHRAAGLTLGVFLGVLSAATLTLLPRFDRDAVLKAIEKRKPTLFPGLPTMYAALAGAPNVRKFNLGSIRACLSVEAALPVDVGRRFEELTGAKLREGYGLTEAGPLTHANPVYGKAKEGTIGLPITDTACLLADLTDARKPAAPGAPGELVVSGPQVMRGYWNRPEETGRVLVDGWLRTGDIATMDADGYFTLQGRRTEEP